MESKGNICWKHAVDSEKRSFDLLKLVEHSEYNFLFKIKLGCDLLGVNCHIEWLLADLFDLLENNLLITLFSSVIRFKFVFMLEFFNCTFNSLVLSIKVSYLTLLALSLGARELRHEDADQFTLSLAYQLVGQM